MTRDRKRAPHLRSGNRKNRRSRATSRTTIGVTFVCALTICVLLIATEYVFAGMDAQACRAGVAEACGGAR